MQVLVDQVFDVPFGQGGGGGGRSSSDWHLLCRSASECATTLKQAVIAKYLTRPFDDELHDMARWRNTKAGSSSGARSAFAETSTAETPTAETPEGGTPPDEGETVVEGGIPLTGFRDGIPYVEGRDVRKEGFPIRTPRLPSSGPGVQHRNERCLMACGEMRGLCPWCGDEGVCCQAADEEAPEECDGKGGQHGYVCDHGDKSAIAEKREKLRRKAALRQKHKAAHDKAALEKREAADEARDTIVGSSRFDEGADGEKVVPPSPEEQNLMLEMEAAQNAKDRAKVADDSDFCVVLPAHIVLCDMRSCAKMGFSTSRRTQHVAATYMRQCSS